MNINIPLTVPKNKQKEYLKNMELATHGSGNLMMFAGDQKVEHLNDDFVGRNLPQEVADPEHYFKIAQKAKIGVFATQLGLISKYAAGYQDIPYMVKVNSKTNLLKEKDKDPFGNTWFSVKDIIKFKKQTKLNIVGIGYTIYIGSWYESDMFRQAADLISRAHEEGLITVIWMYPRGKAVKKEDEMNIHLIAGGAGVALCLGSDFVKVNYPYFKKDQKKTAREFKEVTTAAGKSGVICIGGRKKDPKKVLQALHCQINIAKTRGNAFGRNIYQRPLDEAVKMANAVSAITLYNKDPQFAYEIFQGKKTL
ncbi:MAG: aldolase [Candidatus Moranbacteria bacterium]|nr:aldolase [Candidatus Moranbacteria bacterium]